MNCVELSSKIEVIQSRILNLRKLFLSDQTLGKEIQRKENELAQLKKQFQEGNCDVVLADLKTQQTLGLIKKYQDIDKERIETESKFLVRKRVFFGAIVIATFVVIIATYKKK